jgi:hypothetical protein
MEKIIIKIIRGQERRKKKKKTIGRKMEPPMPEVLICYITNEGVRNQKRTRRNIK